MSHYLIYLSNLQDAAACVFLRQPCATSQYPYELAQRRQRYRDQCGAGKHIACGTTLCLVILEDAEHPQFAAWEFLEFHSLARLDAEVLQQVTLESDLAFNSDRKGCHCDPVMCVGAGSGVIELYITFGGVLASVVLSRGAAALMPELLVRRARSVRACIMSARGSCPTRLQSYVASDQHSRLFDAGFK